MGPWVIGVIGLLVGIVGIGLGGLIGISIKKTDKILSFFLGLSGGFMLFIVSFHLLPEAFYLGGTLFVMIGIFVGIVGIIAIEKILELLNYIPNMTKTGILLGLGMAVHNFP